MEEEIRNLIYGKLSHINGRELTQVWIKESPEQNVRLMNQISFSSRFRSMHRKEGLAFPHDQLSIAKEIVEGWKTNGPYPEAKFCITQSTEYGEFVFVK